MVTHIVWQKTEQAVRLHGCHQRAVEVHNCHAAQLSTSLCGDLLTWVGTGGGGCFETSINTLSLNTLHFPEGGPRPICLGSVCPGRQHLIPSLFWSLSLLLLPTPHFISAKKVAVI